VITTFKIELKIKLKQWQPTRREIPFMTMVILLPQFMQTLINENASEFTQNLELRVT